VSPKLKKTAALHVFEANLDRSRAFLRIFDYDRGVGNPKSDEKELLRGSLVFAVGAFDAYLSDLILEVVPKFGPQTSQLHAALKAIAKEDPGLSLRVALATTEADRQAEFKAALGDWLNTKSFHGPDKVAQALGYVGCPVDWEAMKTAAGVGAAPDLEKITKQRHSIVHEGKKPTINRWPAEAAGNLVNALASHIDGRVCAMY
jgi:hypothetical protein